MAESLAFLGFLRETTRIRSLSLAFLEFRGKPGTVEPVALLRNTATILASTVIFY